jgi:hypothetical protein
MKPNLLGRKLGIGVRVASKMLMDRAAQSGTETAATPSRQHASPITQVYAANGKAVVRESRRFGSSIWRPFAHASGILWLEVTGLFFGIFTLFFASNTYKLRDQWANGPDHQRFLVYLVVTIVFGYFTFSSFYRARKKEKLKRRAAC